MRKIGVGIVVALLVVWAYNYFKDRNREVQQLTESTQLIQKEIRNVGKLVVTEGSFAQVFTYEDSKKFYLDVFSAKKKALIVVNAQVTVAYDLRRLETEIDPENKTITISNIPEAEVTINPDIEYYDVTQDYLNQFDAKDYNAVKNRVNALISTKIKASGLTDNARNRLLTELSNIYLLTRSLGWTLKYEDVEIKQEAQLEDILL